MAYTFKSITDIDSTDIINENLNLIAEQGGKATKIKSTIFPKLNNDGVSNSETWSSKNIIDTFCPPFKEEELIVKCFPMSGSSLEIISKIDPIQEGDGPTAPDNIRPISGWDTINLTRCGKNLLPNAFKDGQTKTTNGIVFTNNGDGSVTVNGVASDIALYNLTSDLVMKAGQTYYLSGENSGIRTALYYKNAEGNSLYWNTLSGGLKWEKEYTLVNIYIGVSKGITANNVVIKPQISTEIIENYEPYKGDTYSIDLNETVYGGSFNWTTGTLTKTYNTITLTGAESFTKNGTRTQYYWEHGQANGAIVNPVCSHFVGDCEGSYDDVVKEDSIGVRGTRIWLYSSRFNTVAELKAYLKEQYEAGTPITIVYSLVEPIGSSFEAQEIQAISGTNIIYSDSGNTVVAGRKDLIQTINNLTERISILENN